MFNDIQKSIYTESITRIKNTLESLVNRSKNYQSALDALFCMVKICIDKTGKTVIEHMSLTFYPEQQFAPLRSLFNELHDLLHNASTNHTFVALLNDLRLFTQPRDPLVLNELKRNLRTTTSTKMKYDLQNWLVSHPLFKQEHINRLLLKYNNELESLDGSTYPRLHSRSRSCPASSRSTLFPNSSLRSGSSPVVLTNLID